MSTTKQNGSTILPVPTEKLSIKVLTVNMHKGFTALNRQFILPELRDAVRSVGADVVFLQEVLGANQKHAAKLSNWPSEPQYEFLADSMWPHHAYGRNAVYPHGDHGNALLSKFNILHYENLDVSISGPERRGLLHATLQWDQQFIHVVCVHLGLTEGHRQKQLRLLCQLLESVPTDRPVIVAGDFNDWRRTACQVLSEGAGLQEVFMDAYGTLAKSFPARFPLLSLDRIYVRRLSIHNPQILSTKPWSHLSDHAPLAVELRLLTS